MYAAVYAFGMLLACFEETPLHLLSMLYSHIMELCVYWGKLTLKEFTSIFHNAEFGEDFIGQIYCTEKF